MTLADQPASDPGTLFIVARMRLETSVGVIIIIVFQDFLLNKLKAAPGSSTVMVELCYGCPRLCFLHIHATTRMVKSVPSV